jgi:hypothetical protein
MPTPGEFARRLVGVFNESLTGDLHPDRAQAAIGAARAILKTVELRARFGDAAFALR